ncbi:hypothetical protein JQ617_17535 [Bradyrhizobium sp. KB893862 SZCCT0404]|uniref:hypothetical protein n=1 Tax=Bradyrhizobium sp. KB893862 SZCCT0404 TaxID=2807672 RepID=UPI001BABC228|nr:hypothetical protein [Bradyrhizobium sp. KB893862 SZCCT0404]MBR1175763.1 hypothetical protein [Bradyrhizobium sp. KB893862 SZCCT0404]
MSDDKKALRILFDTYWSPKGWKRDETVDRAEFEYARRAGYMFDPVVVAHDDIVAGLVSVRARVNLQRVADAFLASLSTRRLELRSALGSFAYAAQFPIHGLDEQTARRVPSGRLNCLICGRYGHASPEQQDLNILSFERWRWGGIRHADPLYSWFDLTQFEKADLIEPTEEDCSILARILDTATSLASVARPKELEKRLGKVIKSNRAERCVLIQILGYCGVLKPAGRNGFLQAFTADELRDRPPDRANDWTYPVIWWRGADGVDRDVLSRLFPKVAAMV